MEVTLARWIWELESGMMTLAWLRLHKPIENRWNGHAHTRDSPFHQCWFFWRLFPNRPLCGETLALLVSAQRLHTRFLSRWHSPTVGWVFCQVVSVESSAHGSVHYLKCVKTSVRDKPKGGGILSQFVEPTQLVWKGILAWYCCQKQSRPTCWVSRPLYVYISPTKSVIPPRPLPDVSLSNCPLIFCFNRV